MTNGTELEFRNSNEFMVYFNLQFWFGWTLVSLKWAGKKIYFTNLSDQDEIVMFGGVPILESSNLELIELFEMFMANSNEFYLNKQPKGRSLNASIDEVVKNRKQPETMFLNFPESIDINQLEFESYVLGDRLVKSPTKDLQFFDTVSFLSENTSLKTNRKRIQALGTVYKTKKNTIINLRSKVA